MVYGAGTEFSMELFCAEAPQILNGERPQVEDIVAGERVSLLQQDHLGSQKGKFYSRAQATWSCSDDQTLYKHAQKVHKRNMRFSGLGINPTFTLASEKLSVSLVVCLLLASSNRLNGI